MKTFAKFVYEKAGTRFFVPSNGNQNDIYNERGFEADTDDNQTNGVRSIMDPYEPEFWHWTVASMVERLLLVMTALLSVNVVVQSSAALSVTVLSLMTSVRCRPFVNDAEDYSDMLARAGNFLLALVAVLSACEYIPEGTANGILVSTTAVVGAWTTFCIGPIATATAVWASIQTFWESRKQLKLSAQVAENAKRRMTAEAFRALLDEEDDTSKVLNVLHAESAFYDAAQFTVFHDVLYSADQEKVIKMSQIAIKEARKGHVQVPRNTAALLKFDKLEEKMLNKAWESQVYRIHFFRPSSVVMFALLFGELGAILLECSDSPIAHGNYIDFATGGANGILK
jgi:hypothetical protein